MLAESEAKHAAASGGSAPSRYVSCGASIPKEANCKLRRIPCLARNLFMLPTSA